MFLFTNELNLVIPILFQDYFLVLGAVKEMLETAQTIGCILFVFLLGAQLTNNHPTITLSEFKKLELCALMNKLHCLVPI